MAIKKGDIVGVTVSKEWADAVGPVKAIHYFPGDDTPTSRLFIAKLFSITDSEGLWVEGFGKGQNGMKLLVPWPYIYAIRLGLAFEAKRTAIGFEGMNKFPD